MAVITAYQEHTVGSWFNLKKINYVSIGHQCHDNKWGFFIYPGTYELYT
jgi:hypothetical protein